MRRVKFFGILTILFAVSKFIECDNLQQQGPSLFCSDLNPQNSIDIEQILGMWYGNEIILHHDHVRGEVPFDECVIIHLADITHEITTTRPRRPDGFNEYHDRQVFLPDLNRPIGAQFYHYLRLIWSSQDLNLEYTLRFNTTRRGFWISSSPQKGTMLKLNYGQFSGTIQVMKAVGSHMVLTFCENLPGSQLFSIVLSRKPNTMSIDDLISVRSLLNRRGLSSVSVRKVCNGSSSMHSIPVVSLLATVFVAFLLKTL